MADSNSYDNVLEKWHPEVTHYSQMQPIVLVGTKVDMREGDNPVTNPVTKEMGQDLAEKIGAYGYVECSATKRKNINKVFEEAIRSVINPKPKTDKKNGKEHRKCRIL